jgi:hypothetical protein
MHLTAVQRQGKPLDMHLIYHYTCRQLFSIKTLLLQAADPEFSHRLASCPVRGLWS